MRNLELKARCHDPALLLARALELGASDHGVLRQADTYYRSRRGRLQLRQMPDQDPQLIFYRRRLQASSRFSHYEIVPVPFEHTERLRALLAAALGEIASVQKERRLLLYRHTRIHLDHVYGLGDFVEVVTVMFDDLDPFAAKVEHDEVRQALGIAADDIVAASYGDLLRERS